MSCEDRRLRLVAHRGWPAAFPENSLAAFAAALAAGADELELDVWCTADLVPVVCHDATVDRTSDLSGPIGERSLRELRAAKIRTPWGEMIPGMGFPTLAEVLDAVNGRVPVNIHVKQTGPDGLILRWLRERFAGQRPSCGTYIAGGRAVLEAARELAPEIPRCCLAERNDSRTQLDNALAAACERLQFARLPRQEDVEAALEAGMITNLFWSDDPDEIVALYGRGILAPLTNDIGRVRAALDARGFCRE